ncbi:MAG TPA: hypothetical protein VHJ17_17330, partial [Thermomonospora sp.]|nr:hypothetical protein [Thermomonospora sp.]
MDHPSGIPSAAALLFPDGLPGWPAVLRAVALLGAALVAGTALLRPFTGPLPRTRSLVVSPVAAVTVPCALVAVNRPPMALLLAPLTLAAALALPRPRRACGLGAAL